MQEKIEKDTRYLDRILIKIDSVWKWGPAFTPIQ